MPKRVISFSLSPEAIDRLDQDSKALGMSKSQYIDMMVKKGFHFSEEDSETVSQISKLQGKLKEKIAKRRLLYDS